MNFPFHHVCVYEDQEALNFLPYTINNPVFTMRCGASTLLERSLRIFENQSLSVFIRPYIKAFFQSSHPKIPANQHFSKRACLFLNGRVLICPQLIEKLLKLHPQRNQAIIKNGQLIACLLIDEKIDAFYAALEKCSPNASLIEMIRNEAVLSSEIGLIVNEWEDLLNFQSKALSFDCKLYQMGIIKGKTSSFLGIHNESLVAIESEAIVDDFVYLDASAGPIIIDKYAHIMAHSYIKGPAYIGQNTTLKHAKIHQAVIGPCCKIGGEISASVFQAFSNKGHEGYIGNSFVGHWVNLAALSTTSNLKINYSPIRYDIQGEIKKTQDIFLGSIIGDYVKTSIGTLLNPGALIGLGSVLLGNSAHSGTLSPFSWGSPKHYTHYQFEKFCQALKTMMERRNQFLQPDVKIALAQLHEAVTASTSK